MRGPFLVQRLGRAQSCWPPCSHPSHACVPQTNPRARSGRTLVLEVIRGTSEVQGVSPEIVKHLSRRRREIEQAMAERGEHSMNAASTAAPATRKGKDYGVPIGALREDWRRRAAGLGLDRAGFDDLLAAPHEHHERQPVSLDDLTRHIDVHPPRRRPSRRDRAAHRLTAV